MKKLTKSLLPAVALMAAGVVSLTGTTYAWFQQSNNGQVAAFDANVVSASGVLMSWDAETWASQLTVGSTAQHYDYNGNTNRAIYTDDTGKNNFYTPVSTNGAVTNGALSFFTAELDATDTGKLAKAEAATIENGAGAYLKYDIYFLVQEAGGLTLYLDYTNSAINAKTLSDSTQDTTGAQTSIMLASRVAFIDQGYTAIDDDAIETARGMAGGTEATIWEPNATTHTAMGSQDGYTIDGSNNVNTATSGKFDYFGIASAWTDTSIDRKAYTQGKLEKVVDTWSIDSLTVANEDAKTAALAAHPKFVLEQGINKITVYVWVEGQDADCTNYLSGTNLQSKLQFTKDAPAYTVAQNNG